ncbi:thiosulfate sulfurtransferase-like [Babylonia areolata]|uniref:thiosulfate sulfurtransferase-like n=1 Tax=Babylonia areolata TaxID=304850 RepID=UPI003FD652D9
MTITRFRTLVSTHWLRDQLFDLGSVHKSSALRILDASTTFDPAEDGYKEFYLQSHIPHAVHFNLHKVCPSSPSSLAKFPVPDVNRFQDYAEDLGISNNTHVVTYDRTNIAFALKTWWLFRLFGHTKVSVLDGGFDKWLVDGFEVSSEIPEIKRSSFQPAFNPSLLQNFEDIEENLKTREKLLIDARGSDMFLNSEDEDRGGHIPGSKNIPYTSLFEEDGTFKPAAELKSAFDAAGVDLGQKLVATCLRGMTACGLAAAAHILGKEVVPVYNGSFREWGQRAKPEQIATGNQVAKK